MTLRLLTLLGFALMAGGCADQPRLPLDARVAGPCAPALIRLDVPF